MLVRAAVSHRKSYGIASFTVEPNAKYTITVKNWGDDTDQNDFVLISYGEKEKLDVN